MLTPEQQKSIIRASKLGYSNRGIAKVVGCHHSTVSVVLSQPSHPPKNPPKRHGPPPLITSPDRRRLKDFATGKWRNLTADEIRQAWEEAEGQSVSVTTIRRALY